MSVNLSRLAALPIIFFIASLLPGCAVNRATATVDPSTNLENIRSIHVKKFSPDKRDIDIIIANKAKAMGLSASTDDKPSTNPDAVITYVDKWMWDITMYMIELTIQVRDPKTDYTLAVGNSYHTSLTRKSPTEMVDEVMNNIFKGVTPHAKQASH